MRTKLTAIVLLLMNFFSCTVEENSSFSNYKLNLKGTKYSWDFNRNFNYKLGLLHEQQFENGILKSPAYFEGDLWAINMSTAQICKFNSDLQVVTAKGKKGDGFIDENEKFNHFFVNSNYYYVFDPNRFVLKRYELKEDTLVDYRYFDKFNTAIANIGSDNFYLAPESESISNSFFFDEYSYYKDEHKNLGSINDLMQIPKSIDLAYMVYDGQLVSGKDYVVYYFFKVGKFLVFDSSKGFKYEMNTIDETPAPQGLIESDGSSEVYTTNPKHTFFLDAQVYENKLYLLSKIAENDHHCIDIYDLDNKSYLGSIKLDELSDTQLPVSFAVSDTDLVVIYEDMIMRKYKIEDIKLD